MAPVKQLSAFPATFLAYAVGWWGTQQAGLAGQTLPFLWLATYYGVFWGGWFAIPLLGAGATLLNPMLPEGWKGPVRSGFLAWLLAWLGVLVGLLWLGAPPGFRAVPI